MGSRYRVGLLLLLLTLQRATPAAAQQVAVSFEPAAQAEPPPKWKDARGFGWFAAGALSGFVFHEGGHIFANLIQGNTPRFRPIRGFGFIPFVAITPNIHCQEDVCYKRNGQRFRTGHRGRYVISTGGFTVQHLTDEILLARRPNLRAQKAPYLKGLLAFNILLSFGYAVAAVTGIENAEGDVTNAATTLEMHPSAYAALLLVPAALDTYRYFVPSSRWAPWLSRAGKATLVGLVFTI